MENPPESGRDANTRDLMQALATALNEVLPQNWGFVLLCFPFDHEPGRMNYVSNANREDVLKVMQEFIDKNNNPDDFATHNL
jgi:hypothetical protein